MSGDEFGKLAGKDPKEAARQDGRLAGIHTKKDAVEDDAASLRANFTSVPRLEPGSAEASAYLEEHGYVVLRSVLSDAEVATAIDLTWAYLEGLGTGIVRRQPPASLSTPASSICSVCPFNRPLRLRAGRAGAGRPTHVGRRPLAHRRARRDPARPRHRAVRGAVVHPRILSRAGGV